jgi:hypothetical protein
VELCAHNVMVVAGHGADYMLKLGKSRVIATNDHLLNDLFCQFQILMVWSSEHDTIHGNSW